MTDRNGITEHIREGGKSLKEQNRWQLWIIVAANTLLLYGVAEGNAFKVDGLRAIFKDAQNLLPVGLALVITTVLNGLLSADAKARLVFLRWRHALPGHRAFTKYALMDPRIDVIALQRRQSDPLPVDPVAQNQAWYRIYKTVEKEDAVRQTHRDFLLLRDYAGLSVVFIALYGSAGFFMIASVKIALYYLSLLITQFVIVRQSAQNYGIRMVTTVLAHCLVREQPTIASLAPKRPRRTTIKDESKT